MSMENIAKDLEARTIGLDDTFKFHCTACGKCCINREDILLNPRDLYRIAKHLSCTPLDVYQNYCESYIGSNTHIPIIRLKPKGHVKRCPFLKDRKCAVHEAKPGVCAMFPLGRYMKIDSDDYKQGNLDNPVVKYLIQPIDCGDNSCVHTVREWLSGFNIALEDHAFIRWHQEIARIGGILHKAEKKLSAPVMGKLWDTVLILLYLNYDVTKDYLQQFEENAAELMAVLQTVEMMMKGI